MVELNLTFGFPLYRHSLWVKRVVQITQWFLVFDGPNRSGTGTTTKKFRCPELEPEIEFQLHSPGFVVAVVVTQHCPIFLQLCQLLLCSKAKARFYEISCQVLDSGCSVVSRVTTGVLLASGTTIECVQLMCVQIFFKSCGKVLFDRVRTSATFTTTHQHVANSTYINCTQ